MKYTFLLFSLSLFIAVSNAQIGIGTLSPNPAAALDINSGNKGLLIPRVSKANRPAAPVPGLLIYQTDNLPGFYYYTSTGWKRMYAVTETDTMVVNPNPGQATDPAATAGATGTITGADGNVYTTVRLGDGSVWLQQNLGSSRVATAADDVQSYGDLYQWGRWTDGHEKRTPVFSRTITTTEPNPNNPDGLIKQWGSNVNPFYYGNSISWWYNSTTQFNANNITDNWSAPTPSTATADNGCDPCRLLLGGSWRLPTRTEFEGLSSSSLMTGIAITGISSGFSSYLKFTGGGFRERLSTTLSDVGSAGNYWSSTALSANNSQVYYLVVGQSTRFSVQGNFRGFGYSIRCKKD